MMISMSVIENIDRACGQQSAMEVSRAGGCWSSEFNSLCAPCMAADVHIACALYARAAGRQHVV